MATMTVVEAGEPMEHAIPETGAPPPTVAYSIPPD